MDTGDGIVTLDAIAFEVDERDALTAMGMDAQAPFASEALGLLRDALPIARPKGVYKFATVDPVDDRTVALDGVRFSSRVLRVNLEGRRRAFPFVATCGAELEAWSRAHTRDPMHQFWADAIKELALRCAIEALGKHLVERFRPGERAMMNPGSLEDWPLSEQPRLFSLFGDHIEKIGVRLTESLLMMPVKSVSGVWFETESGFVNCQLCPRADCPNRRAAFDPHAFGRDYG